MVSIYTLSAAQAIQGDEPMPIVGERYFHTQAKQELIITRSLGMDIYELASCKGYDALTKYRITLPSVHIRKDPLVRPWVTVDIGKYTYITDSQPLERVSMVFDVTSATTTNRFVLSPELNKKLLLTRVLLGSLQ